MAIAVPLRRASRSEEGARTAGLFRAHGAELLRFAWHRLGRLEDAEDAVQATFLSAHRVLVEGERIREPRAWLFKILRNECLTRIAMSKRRGVHEHLEEWHADERLGVAEQVEQRDEFETTLALLASLPGSQRDALVLREWLGLSSVETATIIDSTPQGVDALIYRARKSLVAVPDDDDQSTCADARRALAVDEITVRTRAHLVGCRSCRAAALRLRAPEEATSANGMLPLDSLAESLGVLVPGFAAALGITVLGGATATAAPGSAMAAGTAGAVAVPAGGTAAVAATTAATATVGTATATTAVASGAALGAKVAVGLALGVGVAGGTVATVPAVREAITPIVQIEGERPQAETPRIENGDGKRIAIADPPPAAAEAGSYVEPPRTPKGVVADATFKDAAVGAPPAEAAAVEAASAAAAAAVVAEPTAPAVAEESSVGAAAVANVIAASAVEAEPEAAKAALVVEEKARREAERAAEKAKREAERAATVAAKMSKSEGSGVSAAAVTGASF